MKVLYIVLAAGILAIVGGSASALELPSKEQIADAFKKADERLAQIERPRIEFKFVPINDGKMLLATPEGGWQRHLYVVDMPRQVQKRWNELNKNSRLMAIDCRRQSLLAAEVVCNLVPK